MKSIFIIIFASILSFLASGQEQPDSTTVNKTLDEITVQALPVIRKADRDVYTVDDNVRHRSATSMNLLSNLGIPSLSVNTVMKKITVNGAEVEVRINGRKASQDQLDAIQVENIRRIEFLDNPGLKYDGASVVINVIAVNPEQGGSLMLNVMQALNYGWSNPMGYLTLERGHHQIKVGGRGMQRNHLPMYRDYYDRFRLPDGSVVERSETPDDGQFTDHGIYPGIDYNYLVPEKTNLYISAYFPMNIGQEMKYVGDLTTKGVAGKTHLVDRQLDPNKHQVLSAYLEQQLPASQTIMANIGWQNANARSRRIYSETPETRDTGESINIDNNIRSHTTSWSAETDYTKKFGRTILTAGLRYSGSTVLAHYLFASDPSLTVRQTNDRLYFFGEYTSQLGKVNLSAGAAGTWQDYGTAGIHHSTLHFTPRISANMRYNDISRWTLTMSAASHAPSLTETSSVAQQIDGYLYRQGNPDLKAFATYSAQLRYGFALGSRFSGNITTSIQHSPRPVQEYYTWNADKILQSWDNEGHSTAYRIFAAPRYELIKGWTTVDGMIGFTRYWNRGLNFNHTLSNWYGSANLQLYHWGFNATLSYNRAPTFLTGESIETGETYSMAQIGYRYKEWYFEAGLFMPFGRYSQEVSTMSHLVTKKTILRTDACNRMPFITITYTTNWGRKTRNATRKLESDFSGSGASAAGR